MWQPIETPASPKRVFQYANALYLLTKEVIFKRSDGLWQEYLKAPNKAGYTDVYLGEKGWFCICGGCIYRIIPSPTGMWNLVPNHPKANAPGFLATASKDTLWCYLPGKGLLKYDPISETGWESFANFTELLPENPMALAATSAGAFLLFPEEAKKRFATDKKPVPTGVVWWVCKEDIKDITDGLTMRDIDGKLMGIAGDIVADGEMLYLSTEEGVYRRRNLQIQWEKLYQTWGIPQLDLVSLGDMLISSPTSHYPPILWKAYNSSQWRCGDRVMNVKNGTLFKDVIYTLSGEELKSFDTKLLVSAHPASPEFASYLPCPGKATTVKFVTNDKFCVAADRFLYLFGVDGLTKAVWSTDAIIEDLDCTSDFITYCTAKELVLLDTNLRLVWRISGGFRSPKCSATDSVIAFTYANEHILLVDLKGKELLRWKEENLLSADILIKDKTVYLCGYNQVGSDRISVPFLKAWRYDPKMNKPIVLWKRWGLNAEELKSSGLLADSKLLKMSSLPDGNLILLGEISGANTIFGNDLIQYDPYNMAAPTTQVYVAIASPSGEIVRHQVLLPRTHDMKPGKSFAGAIGQFNGILYVGASCSHQIQNREFTKFLGEFASAYTSIEPTVCAIPQDMQQRLWWFVPSGEKVQGDIISISSFEDRLLVLVQPSNDRTKLVTSANTKYKVPSYSDSPYVIIWYREPQPR